ncbi:hypothetical protein niasHT_000559 [Heterodera trifolii]|uniref:Uncharacterized protein n=1 Tax=Heterodera trifolii TaxID=157864 RepID=A0ABD2M493_9BILA
MHQTTATLRFEKRRVDKFYQKQSSLVECFEQDSKQIQNYQSSDRIARANFNDQHLLENGGDEPAQEFDDSTVSTLLEPPPPSLVMKNEMAQFRCPKFGSSRPQEGLSAMFGFSMPNSNCPNS